MSDYISREALIKAVEGNPYVTDSVKSYVRCTARSIPSADVHPVVKGKWIKCDVEKWRNGALKCSECGKGYHLPHEVTLFDWNFCPNCGADIREDAEHETTDR